MPNIISGKHFKLTPTLKDYITEQMHKVKKFSPAPVKEMKVELDVDRNQRRGDIFRVEASIQLPGKIIKAGHKAEHMREAIDLCMPKLARQIKKYKTKFLKSKSPGQKSIRN